MGCIRTGQRWRWPKGVIPYVIPDDVFDADEVTGIRIAIDEWARRTRLVFRLRGPSDDHWVEFVQAKEVGACSSHVGRKLQPGRQLIPCDPSRGSSTGDSFRGESLVHELGHAVGLWHEQSRSDRDARITVNFDQVLSSKRGQFDRHVDDGSDIGIYDYRSAMHYSKKTFAVRWTPGEDLTGRRSTDGPAMVGIGGELHVVHLGNGSRDLWHSWSGDAQTWLSNNRIPDQGSRVGPVLTEHAGDLHMVHLGTTSNDLWHSVCTDRRTWPDDRRTRLASRYTPALASFGGLLHMVRLRDDTNELWHSRSSNGIDWVDRPVGQSSQASPALAVSNGALHMVHLGNTTQRLWHSWTDDGVNWFDDVEIEDQRSGQAPALAVFDGKLQLSHLGTTSGAIWHSAFDGTWEPNLVRNNNRTLRPSALVVHAGKLYQAHLEEGRRQLRLSHFDTNLTSFETQHRGRASAFEGCSATETWPRSSSCIRRSHQRCGRAGSTPFCTSSWIEEKTMAQHDFIGQITRIAVREDGSTRIVLDLPVAERLTNDNFKIEPSHANYKELYSLALTAAVNKYQIWVRTDTDVDPGDPATVRYLVVDW